MHKAWYNLGRNSKMSNSMHLLSKRLQSRRLPGNPEEKNSCTSSHYKADSKGHQKVMEKGPGLSKGW